MARYCKEGYSQDVQERCHDEQKRWRHSAPGAIRHSAPYAPVFELISSSSLPCLLLFHSTKVKHLLKGHTSDIHTHQLSDTHMLASCDLGGQIRLWDLRTGSCVCELEHQATVHAFQFDGSRLVRGGSLQSQAGTSK